VGLGRAGRRPGRGLAVRPPGPPHGHRVKADIGKVNDERYSHSGSMDPDLGAPVSLYTQAEETARPDKDPDAPR
jgi:hypothetical protein